MKIVAAISHMDEITLDMCVRSLEAQTHKLDAIEVVAGKTPMCESFNASLDFALDCGADLLLHTASDVVAFPHALAELLAILDVDRNYLSVGRGHDVMHGRNACVGLWVWNMRIMRDQFRFRNEFKQDLKLCQRVEETTGATRVYTPKNNPLGDHHPIWTPQDMFMKFRYATQKWADQEVVLDRVNRFFIRELGYNPDNKPLRIGYDAYCTSMSSEHEYGSKDYHALAREFEQVRARYDLDGTEYFVLRQEYKPIAQQLLNSRQDYVTLDERDPHVKETRDLEAKKKLRQLTKQLLARRQRAARLVPKGARQKSRSTWRQAVARRLPEPVKSVLRAAEAAFPWTITIERKKKKKSSKSLASRKKRRRGFLQRMFGGPRKRVVSALKKHTPLPVKNAYWRMKNAYRQRSGPAEQLPRFRYGSATPGRSEWGRKWDASPGKRVLMFAWIDYAGSMLKWAEAVNRYSPYAARVVVFRTHEFGYQNDLYVPYKDSTRFRDLRVLVDEADVVHVKDEHYLYLNHQNRDYPALSLIINDDILRSKVAVFTHYGGRARINAVDEGYRQYVRQYAGRVAMTPDLNFDWFDGLYIPHTIDADKYRYMWRDVPILGHSPTSKLRKGTEHLEQAVESLAASGEFAGWTFDMIHGVSHQECLQRKANSGLFFDQAGVEPEEVYKIEDRQRQVIGWYGNSALEAAVHGIPTIAHLSDAAFARSANAGKPIREACPFLNTPLGSQGIADTLRDYLQMSSAERRELSLRTRQWIEDFHSYRVVGRELADLYDGLLNHPQRHTAYDCTPVPYFAAAEAALCR